MNKIIDGKLISSNIKENLKNDIAKLNIKPKLVVIQVGNDTASNIYVKNKNKAATQIGMDFIHIQFEDTIEENSLIEEINILNNDSTVNGIIIQLPLPKHLNKQRILNTIVDYKDVDGLTDINLGKLFNNETTLTSCTPTGIIELLKAYQIQIEGKHAVIVGRSALVGKPLMHLLLKENATVTICHSKTENLKYFTQQADILVVAVGRKDLITSDMIKDDVVVIDVGMNRVDDKLYGDVDFKGLSDKASYITPVPGGVGPMTIAILLKNTLKSYNLMHKKDI